MQISALYAAVGVWLRSTGIENLKDHPGNWHGRTDRAAGLGPFDIRINASKSERDGIPAFGLIISKDGYLPGVVAMLGPFGGCIMSSQIPDEDEAGLIKHFAAQPALRARDGGRG